LNHPKALSATQRLGITGKVEVPAAFDTVSSVHPKAESVSSLFD
jgi:hypothetical protein